MTFQELQQKYGVTVTPAQTNPYAKYGATYTPPVSTLNKVGSFIGQPDLQNYLPDYLKLAGTNIIPQVGNAIVAGAQSIGNSLKNVYEAPGNQITDYFSNKPVSQKIADFTHALGADVGGILSPITATFAGAEKIAALKPAVDVVNAIFTPVGKIGNFATEQFVNVLPIDQASKNALKPAFGEVGGLAAQIILGGKALDLVTKGLPFGKTEVKTIENEAKTEALQAEQSSINTAKEQLLRTPKKDAETYLNEIAKSEASKPQKLLPAGEKLLGLPSPSGIISGEGFTMTESVDKAKLKVIKAINDYNDAVAKFIDKPTNSNLKSVSSAKIIRDTAVENFKSGILEKPVKNARELKSAKLPETIKEVVPVSSKEIKSNVSPEIKPLSKVTPESTVPETKTRGLSLGVESKAIAEGLTNSIGDLPEYQTVNMADQAQRAVDLLTKDPELARKVALGQEASPQGIIPEAMFKAVEDQAIKSKDIATINELARSGLTGEATVMGQRIRTLAERDPLSPVSAIKDVLETRKESLKRKVKDIGKATKETVDTIKTEIKKATPKVKTWTEFIDTIKC